MRSLTELVRKGLLLAAFWGICACAVAQNNFYTVSGSVKDKITRKPLEYVTITVVGNNIGTVSNSEGEFSLKIPQSADASFVEVSHIGYYSHRIPIKGEDISDREVALTPYANPLSEVVITGWDARYLVEEAVKKIGENYSPHPTMLTGFYRETIQKRRNYINISEALIDAYKTEYTENAEKDRVQILKGRKLLSPKKSDTLSVKLVGGPNMSVFVDIVKNPDILLDEETLSYFSYRMEGITQLNGRDQYLVYFQPQRTLHYPLYSGIYYIDKESLAFTRAEFHLDMSDRNKASEMILKKKPAGLRFRPEEVSYTVSYQERNGKVFLNYIRNEVKFKCDWKSKLFSTNYEIISEMVVTDIAEEDVVAISRKDAFLPSKSLSENVMGFYDKDFWGAYNIIEPTESLESAVNKLKKKQKPDDQTALLIDQK